jgi:hypothetical protein
MAAADGGEVVVDPKAIDAAAESFKGWGDDLLASLTGLATGAIQPGLFPAATDLLTLVDTRTTSLITNVTNLGNAFIEISTKLTDIAKEYRDTEDKNEGEANRIDGVILGVNDKFDDPAPEPA